MGLLWVHIQGLIHIHAKDLSSIKTALQMNRNRDSACYAALRNGFVLALLLAPGTGEKQRAWADSNWTKTVLCFPRL